MTANRTHTTVSTHSTPNAATPATVAEARIRSWPADHGIHGSPFLSHRVTLGGATLAYTGDTAWTDALIELAADADLFIAEAYFWDILVPYHLRHADLVTHAEYAAFELAHDGLSLTL